MIWCCCRSSDARLEQMVRLPRPSGGWSGCSWRREWDRRKKLTGCSKQGGLGVFVRSLVGLDRAAAKQALDGFIKGRTLTADQHEFLDSLNRLNVATSRAKCVCVLVASPNVFEPVCRTPLAITG